MNGIARSKSFTELVIQRGQSNARNDLGISNAGLAVLSGTNIFYGDQYITGNVNIISGSINNVTLGQLEIVDQYIITNSAVSAAPILDGGLLVNRGSSTDAAIKWDEGRDKWEFGLLGSEVDIASEPLVASISAGLDIRATNNTNNISSISGNYVTLATPQTISGKKIFTVDISANNIYLNQIYNADPTTSLYLQGGTNKTGPTGANIELYSETHSSQASNIFTDAQQHNYRNAAGSTTYAAMNSGGLFVSSGKLTVDFTNSCVGIGTTTPLSSLHVKRSSGDIWLENTNNGFTSISQTNPGIKLTSTAMNTTSKYTPAVLFGSTDTDFTTTNPKFGAAIVGVAEDNYTNDNAGAMSLEFFATPVTATTSAGNLRSSFKIFSEGITVGAGVLQSSEKARFTGGSVSLSPPVTTTLIGGGSISTSDNIYVGGNITGSNLTIPNINSNTGIINIAGITNLGISVNISGACTVGSTFGVGVNSLNVDNAGKVNINTTTSSAQLTVQGDIYATNYKHAYSTTAATSGINQLSPLSGFIKLTGASPILRGIISPGTVSARIALYFQNNFIISNENALASVADRIATSTGADISGVAGRTVDLVYDPNSNRWRNIG